MKQAVKTALVCLSAAAMCLSGLAAIPSVFASEVQEVTESILDIGQEGIVYEQEAQPEGTEYVQPVEEIPVQEAAPETVPAPVEEYVQPVEEPVPPAETPVQPEAEVLPPQEETQQEDPSADEMEVSAQEYTVPGAVLQDYPYTWQPEAETPVALHGKLSVQGATVTDQNGAPFQLQGISLAAINYDHWNAYANREAFTELRDTWNCNVIRIPMYTAGEAEAGYCTGDAALQEELYSRVVSAAELCSELGMYVIIDWHVIMEGDPNTYIEQAAAFHNAVSNRFANYPNVIYEICNEPNGGDGGEGEWASIKSYAETIIPIIRANDPAAMVIVGTPNYSGSVWTAKSSPIDGGNILYTEHAYTSEDWSGDDRLNDMKSALDAGTPIAVTEISAGTANGPHGETINDEMFRKWMDTIKEYKVPVIFFALCRDDTSCALLDPSTEKLTDWTAEEITDTGKRAAEALGAELVQPHTHTLQKVDRVNPSCQAEGQEAYWICTDETCGKMFSDEQGENEIESPIPIAKADHVWEEKTIRTKEPTCEETGEEVTTQVCKNCSAESGNKKTKLIPALGHTWNEGKITKEPGCSEDGIKTYTCTRDPSHMKTEVISATNHTPGKEAEENRIEPTCEKEGSYDIVVRCTVCEKEISRTTKTIPALGHEWDHGKITKEATCKEEGVKTYTCKHDKSHTKTEPIPKLLHKAGPEVIENKVDPTTEKTGSYDKVTYCTVCKEELSRQHIKLPKVDPQAKTYTLTFDPNGGKWENGSTQVLTQSFPEKTIITIPKAPIRDGYKFAYWEGSQHFPGDSYTVTEDHIFKAVWQQDPNAQGVVTPQIPNNAQAQNKTGDVQTSDTNILPQILICAALAAAIILITIRLKKKK